MEHIVWNGCALDVDLETTRSWYARAETWDCPCGHCRNYLALEGRLPAHVQELMDRVGIVHRKAEYVCELYHRDRELLYEASYLIAGTFAAEPGETSGRKDAVLERVGECTYPPGFGEAFPGPCFVLHLTMWLPWVLPEPIDGPAQAFRSGEAERRA